MQGKWKNGKPKYLNWKCIDNFDKVSDDKIYYDYKDLKLSEKQRRDAKREFDILRVKYTKIIKDFLEECNGQKKTHLTVAGGNYTFFFTLPHVVKWVRERYPFVGVHIQLFDTQLSKSNHLKEQDADIILTGHASNTKFDFSNAAKAGYIYLRKCCLDNVYFATSKNSVNFFGSKDRVLKNQDLLVGRLYANRESIEEISKQYNVKPSSRKISPRVIMDQYFLEYMMMTQDVGMAYVFSSMAFNKEITIIDQHAPESLNRILIIKKKLAKRYMKIGRRLIHLLHHKEGKLK